MRVCSNSRWCCVCACACADKQRYVNLGIQYLMNETAVISDPFIGRQQDKDELQDQLLNFRVRVCVRVRV